MAVDALQEAAPAVAVDERAEDDQRGQGGGFGLVGRDHPIDEVVAVASAARGDENEG
jgi:hypothetical protein